MFAFVLLIIASIITAGMVLFGAVMKQPSIRFGLIAVTGAVWVLTLIVVGASAFFTISAGEVGVRFDPLGGGVSQTQYGEGFHVKAPWAIISVYNAKTQVFTMSGPLESASDQTHAGSVQTTTNEGLYVTLDISVQYRIDSSRAWEVRKNIGTEGQYQQIIVLPQIRSTLRDVVSQYTAAEVYGEGKAKVEGDVFKDLEAKWAPNHIFVESVLLRNVQLPKQLTDSIEAKKTAEQAVLQMQYVLDKEKLEAERKVVEAGGIADANAIIANSITTNYLNWYWLEVLKENPQTIYVVPSNGAGLPVFNVPLPTTTGTK